ncbi:metallophosphoesterase family protein [candidate division WOR-3 bacterium]|nr:metallophosphoesterase family protein [candidate division WOR-3 bacterium]
MKLLHTADLHLHKDKPDRLEILGWIIETGNAQNVEQIIIAGDLFDSDADASSLRPEVRDLFAATSASILIIPGNHDAHSYGRDYDYGAHVTQVTENPYRIIQDHGLCIAAIPFQEKPFSECLENLPEDIDVLIAHGTLYDPSFIFSVIDDIETKYMPIFPKNLEDRARYVALGHLHSRFTTLNYAGTHVVYPGSPISLDTKCTTPRACALVDINEHEIAIQRLAVDPAPYWEQKDFFVFPGNEDTILEGIRQFLKTADPQRIQPYIIVCGYSGKGDKDYRRTLDTITTHFRPMFRDFVLEQHIESWTNLIQHRMVQRFIQKTEHLEEPLRMKLYSITFPILSKVLR